MCKFFLYGETKILIMLNIFDSEDLLESLLDLKFTIRPEDSGESLLVHYLSENLSHVNSKLKITN